MALTPRRIPPLALGVLAAALACPLPAAAARRERDREVAPQPSPPIVEGLRPVGAERMIDIALGSQHLLRVPGNTESVFVADPHVCDVRQVSGGVLLTAKSPGETQITVMLRGEGASLNYRVLANFPTVSLAQAIHSAFPSEEDLQVGAVGSTIYLTGRVGDALTSESVGRMASGVVANSGRKGIEVINLLQVSSPQQVQVHMRFVEISRSALRNMGFNAWMNNQSSSGALFGPNTPSHYCLTCDTQRFVGPANPVQSNAANNAPANPWLPMLTSPINGSFALSFASALSFPVSATLALLESRGAAKTLNEPTLVALSGQQAKFLVGGEFPVPIPDALGHILVQFKSFGVQLNFTPTVLGDDQVHLQLEAEVSDIDKSNGVTLSSAVIPGTRTRQSATSVRLHDGQSFAVAGLLSDKIFSSNSQMPLLGDLPIIGALFRQVAYQRDESELVIMITVNTVKPLDPGGAPTILANDEFVDPNDLQLFLLGTIDNTHVPKANAAARPSGSPDGAVGFSR